MKKFFLPTSRNDIKDRETSYKYAKQMETLSYIDRGYMIVENAHYTKNVLPPDLLII